MPNPDSPLESSPSKGRRSRQVKFALAALAALLLMYLGLLGRRQAILLARIDALDSVRDLLQQKLDDEVIRTDPFAGGPPPPGPEATALVTRLRTEIARFEKENRAVKLSATESLGFRMSQASLANAEHRFAEAVNILTVADEGARPANTANAAGRFLRVLQIRGDSLFGLGKWQDALDRYRQVLAEKPDALATATRAVHCERALPATGEASKSYAGLAAAHNRRGDWLLLQDKSDGALGHYGMAIGILKRLVENEGQSQWKSDLAKSHANRGNAALVQGRPDIALTHFQEAITIQDRLDARARSNDLDVNLGTSHGNWGTALFGQQKLDAAIEHYSKAIEILSRLTNGTPVPAGAIIALSMAYNNRGVALRAQGKLRPATADLDVAIRALERLVDPPPPKGSPTNQPGRGAGPAEAVTVDAIVGYSGNGVEIEARPRRVGSAEPRELTAFLATFLQNRGLTQADLGKPEGALDDFRKATEIYAELVEQEGRADLALSHARSLSSLAWIHATSSDPSVRDGGTALKCALKACELSGWNLQAPLQALAAAYAEKDNFADAVRWQEKALRLASGDDQVDVRSRLELYKSGKPYRAPASKAGSTSP